jgi:hypothetical protein
VSSQSRGERGVVGGSWPQEMTLAKVVQLSDSIRQTEGLQSATVELFARVGGQEFDGSDLRGSGLVAFEGERAWIEDRAITRRMEGDKRKGITPLARPVLSLISAIAERQVGGRGGIYFEGGAIWAARKQGQWRGPIGNVAGSPGVRHPLCLWAPLTRAGTGSLVDGEPQFVQGMPCSCYEVELWPEHFDPAVWQELASVDGSSRSPSRSEPSSDDVVAAMVLIDREGRIRRISFEASLTGGAGSVLWYGTEFRELGVPLDRGTPDQSSP